MKLTDTQLRTAAPRATAYKLPREDGLYLLVNPDGRKHWRLAFTFDGKEKLLSLGRYPAVSLIAARQHRDEARRLLAIGVNPSAQRQVERAHREFEAGNTFKAVATQWLTMKQGTLSEGTLNKARWMLEHLYPLIGNQPMASIEPRDMLAALKTIEETGKLETMHRVKARASEVFRYAIVTHGLKSDPCRDLRGALKPRPAARHHAALLEPHQVAGLMKALHGYTGTPEVCAALQLAPLLFVRPGELRHAQWSQFDLDAPDPKWRYFVGKTKTHHIVPLCTQAVAILKRLYPLTGGGIRHNLDIPHYVFPGARSRQRPMSENAITAALRNLGYTGEQMTGHGFRAMARTLLAELDWHRDAIERQLAHKPSGPLGAAYDRAQFLPERRKMMQAWGDYLDMLRAERPQIAEFDIAA